MIAQDAYLRAILATVARHAFPVEEIVRIVGAGEKQLRAFNMCDGTRTQAQIAKELGLDQGNFSKTLGRWIDEGVVIRVPVQNETRPVHVYPLPDSKLKKATKQ
jgi:DNA-binding Lrp family transcriptional regulator